MTRASIQEPEKRLVFINIGVTPHQHAVLMAEAKRHKETMAQTARRLIGVAIVHKQLTEEE